MEKYSAHSIKRGAISHIMGLMSIGEVVDEIVLGRLLKHSSKNDPFSAVTIRYGGNPVDMAHALRTSENNKLVVRKHNICRRPKRSRLPVTAQEKESPLHVTKIEPMSISFIKGRMSQKRLERFNFVWDLTFYPKRVSRNSSFTGSPEVHHFTPLDLSSDLDVFTLGSTFSRSHAELLVAKRNCK